jgi:D-beta-D-heptose 7-phosphate kinase/D-beta-D-heptose 1-phosphate adenosyltransferase
MSHTHLDFSDKTILCLGDVMLDRFIYGQVHRISPESPVPILHANRSFAMVGGAGNVARNIASLGAQVIFVGVVGNDTSGRELEENFTNTPGIRAHLFREASRQTIQKTRFIAQGQQLLRVDEEIASPCGVETEQDILTLCERVRSTCHAVVLSDYQKGFFTEEFTQKIIQLFQGRPIIVDPKGRSYHKYAGATVLTPNLKELQDYCGFSFKCAQHMEEEAQKLSKTLALEAILVTQGSQGMTLFDGQKPPFQVAAQAREVFDVSGAGDTVVATLAVCMADSMPLKEACRLSNVAAGIVVGKVGTATVSAQELQAAIHHHDTLHSEQKVLSLPQAVDRMKDWRRQGLRVGFTNGCFDLLHLGHLHSIQEAAAHCDRLIVAINSDASVKRLKGDTRPIHNEETRSHVLAALSIVDTVLVFDDETPLRLIEALLPDVLIKGGDYSIDQIVGAPIVQAHGGEVIIVPIKEGHSTTLTVTALSKK